MCYTHIRAVSSEGSVSPMNDDHTAETRMGGTGMWDLATQDSGITDLCNSPSMRVQDSESDPEAEVVRLRLQAKDSLTALRIAVQGMEERARLRNSVKSPHGDDYRTPHAHTPSSTTHTYLAASQDTAVSQAGMGRAAAGAAA
eukprot:CAMPEP_0173350260 /NCGR_PEP_ID=MMETSP1144-20121109/14774_1 /TAXON_ID=483371 /ORGANISM="non described non described, Strain CCMP2298" /LENGTH=142 /DNA_ID=CAMNT_0014298165 /DNA_START=777 /DNA_END=1203 /DNA_ORIENTATION=+